MILALPALTIALAAGFLLTADETEASHFRGGTLGWTIEKLPLQVDVTVDPGPPPVIDGSVGTAAQFEFKGRMLWRHSAFGIPPVGSIVPLGSIDAGDSTTETAAMRVDVVDTVRDLMEGTLVDPLGDEGIPHAYASPSNGILPWVASYSMCCRIGVTPENAHINNPDTSVRFETTVDMTKASGSPLTVGPFLHRCLITELCVVMAPTLPLPQPTYPCRYSTAPEAPNAAVIAPTGTPLTGCLITWDATGAMVSSTSDSSLYSAQYQMGPPYARSTVEVLIEIVCEIEIPSIPPYVAGAELQLCDPVEPIEPCIETRPTGEVCPLD